MQNLVKPDPETFLEKAIAELEAHDLLLTACINDARQTIETSAAMREQVRDRINEYHRALKTLRGDATTG